MSKKFLEHAYGADGEAVRILYDDWAASYDAEIGENGYQTPARLAQILATHISDPNVPILDFGCGTGISGAALASRGFSIIDGLDISPEMINRAREKSIYRKLSTFDPDLPLPLVPGTYPVIVAVGVVSKGAAPPATLDTLMQALLPGGFLAFSYNDHTLKDENYMARLTYWLENGACERAAEYGAHLPGIGLNSKIYLLEKT